MIKPVAVFILDRALATVCLTHFDDCETFYYLRGTEREKREQNERQGEPLSCGFGNIVLNCHANEEQWTEKCRERWVEQKEILVFHMETRKQGVCFEFIVSLCAHYI